MAKLVTLLEQLLDKPPPTVVVQATTWWEIVLACVKLMECGLGVNLSVRVCCKWSLYKYYMTVFIKWKCTPNSRNSWLYTQPKAQGRSMIFFMYFYPSPQNIKTFLATTAYAEKCDKVFAQIRCSGLWQLEVNCYFHEFYFLHFDFVISKQVYVLSWYIPPFDSCGLWHSE